MPATSSRPQKIVRSGAVYRASTRRGLLEGVARAGPSTAPAPRPAARFRGPCRCDPVLASQALICCRRRVAASMSPRSRSISARHSCTSQSSRSGGPVVSGSISAAASAVRPRASSASACVGGQQVAINAGLQARLAGGPQAAQRHLGSVIEPPQLQQRVAFVHGQPQQGGASPEAWAKSPSPVKDGESLLDLPANERELCEAARMRGSGGRRRPLRRSPARDSARCGRPPAGPRMDHESLAVIQPGLGVVG